MKKIDIDEYNLNLDEISVYETYGKLIDKINRNFREIQNNGGGPMGQRGIGRTGCRGKSGPPGRNGENILDEWIAKDAINGCINYEELYHYHENEQTPELNKLIVNKFAHKSVLLTNVVITDDYQVKIVDIDEEDLSYEKLSAIASDYKLKIYNSDVDGKGKHIHLLNSKAATLNEEFLCDSGWSISADMIENSNTEILRIIGRRNSNILNHRHVLELTNNLLVLRKYQSSQKLAFDSGVTEVEDVQGTFELLSQTQDNTYRIPDMTGYMGVWKDTNETTQTWELIDVSELVIMNLVYNAGSGNVAITHESESSPVYLNDSSYIRFKRLNNWVLIDYRFGLTATTPGDVFTVKNFTTKVDLSTVACRTIGWHPSTAMVNEAINDNDTESFFGFFKIDASKITENENPDTFVISNKFANNYFTLDYTSTISNYYITGQVWATMTDVDTICEVIEISPEDLCVTDFELTQG